MALNIIDLNIRPKIEQDNAFLERLHRTTRPDLLQLGLPDPLMENLMQMQFNAQQTSYHTQFPDAEYSIIETKGEAIGCLIVNTNDETIRLVYIALLPQARNQGYGRHVLNILQTEATNANKPLGLSVDAQNTPAKHLYLSSGFQVKNDDGANLEMIWIGHATE